MPEEKPATDWTPIEEHGLIGDLRSAALVALDGTIDWWCPPRFDAPSVFGAVLDPEAGRWSMATVDESVTTRQFYVPGTAILVTRFHTEAGLLEVHDFMPLLRPHDDEHRQRLVRRVTAVRGEVEFTTRLSARPDYGRAHPETATDDDGAVLITADGTRLALSATVDLDLTDGDVTARCTLSADDAERSSALFVLEWLDDGDDPQPCSVEDTDSLFEATATYWRTWLDRSTYAGRWREMIERSAITLKLLTHEPSGAVVAAPTTSLPEAIGGDRNWDYRFVWLRDAAFSLYALLHLGFTDEAQAFVRWLSARIADGNDGDLGPLRVLYDIDGAVPEHEDELDHLRGYEDSRPVRVGNAAAGQLQLDVYGEVIDSVYLFNKYGPGIAADTWKALTEAVEWLADHWSDVDAGMWERRDEPQAHTTSRIMSWVALERMIRTARQRGLPGDLERWSTQRDEIFESIMTECWSEDLQAFTQYAGSEHLDAGVLLIPLVKLLAPTDPRFLSTLAAIEDRLVSDSLVFRYDQENLDDGLSGEEGTFSLCSFWYVEALTRVGRLEDARLALEKMFTYSNHVGLYAEQIGLNGRQLGNFPQAFTHLALISAATNLDRALDGEKGD